MSFCYDHLNLGCTCESCKYIRTDKLHHMSNLQDHGVIEKRGDTLMYTKGKNTGEEYGAKQKMRAMAMTTNYGEIQKDIWYRI